MDASNSSTARALTLEFQRLEFSIGWGHVGAVFLRVRIYPDGTMSFFCSKASATDRKTDISQSVDRIFEAAILKLIEDGVIENPAGDGEAITTPLLAAFAKRSVWVEYRAAEDNVLGESFALVAFNESLHASWSFVSKASASELPGLDEEFLAPPGTDVSYSQKSNIVEQLDEFYYALKKIEPLLMQGRSLECRFQLGLTSATKEYLASRHGKDAYLILANCVSLP